MAVWQRSNKKGERSCLEETEQARLVKVLELDVAQAEDVDKAAVGWADPLLRVRAGSVCVRSVERRPPTRWDGPATKRNALNAGQT